MNEYRPRLNKEEYTLILNHRKNVNVKKDSSSDDSVEPFVLSAWNKENGEMMDIDAYCEHYSLPRKDIKSYKLVSHTGTPYYNILFKEQITNEIFDFDFDFIIEKHIKPIQIKKNPTIKNKDFDKLIYTDVHIGMETDKYKNSMYPVKWDRESILECAEQMVLATLSERESPVLCIDELGDFFDGYNAKTTRGGHDLPQNMTNEEAFDCGLEFKMFLIDSLAPYYDKIICNNICNDNHAGSFGYFVNKAFKDIAEIKYDNVQVHNHRKFINHYIIGDVCFLITHGKDDISLKFGFKPKVDEVQISKIDQYCKQHDLYKQCGLIVFEKGDSHQALFDMCSSDDFYYFNYPALSPSSQWVQNNFKKGRRGFMNASYSDVDVYLKPKFL